jgi:methyl coenzyme M reductase alpha subunit
MPETTMIALLIGYFTAIAIVYLASRRPHKVAPVPKGSKTSRVIAMKIALVLALAFTLTTGMALTAAFGFGFLPLDF